MQIMEKQNKTQVLNVWARKADIGSLRLVTCLTLSNSTFLRESNNPILYFICQDKIHMFKEEESSLFNSFSSH